MHFMRLSLRKGAYAALSSATWQEIRVGMTKGKLVTFIRAVRSDGQKETAGPTTTLRSGRDDKFFAGNGLKSGRTKGGKWSHRIVIPTGAYPDFLLRGSHQHPRVRLSVKKAA